MHNSFEIGYDTNFVDFRSNSTSRKTSRFARLIKDAHSVQLTSWCVRLYKKKRFEIYSNAEVLFLIRVGIGNKNKSFESFIHKHA